MATKVTTETTCDLCGARESKTEWRHELPTVFGSNELAGANFTSLPRADYCADCVSYIAAAIEQAKAERRTAEAPA